MMQTIFDIIQSVFTYKAEAEQALWPLILAAVGAAGSIGTGIAGAVKSSRAAKKAKKQIEQDKKENQNWYNRRYNEDVTQRADAQRILSQTEDYIRNRNRASAGVQAVQGGTEESTAATKAANAQALSDATAAIAAQGDARKDQIEEQYLNRKNALDDQLAGVEAQRAANISNAVSQASGAFANVMGAAASMGDPNTATGATTRGTGAGTNSLSPAYGENAALKAALKNNQTKTNTANGTEIRRADGTIVYTTDYSHNA